jgi:hypothetical protein
MTVNSKEVNSYDFCSRIRPLDYNSKLLLAFRIDFYDAWSSKYENDLIIAGTVTHLVFLLYFFVKKTVRENEKVLVCFKFLSLLVTAKSLLGKSHHWTFIVWEESPILLSSSSQIED